MGIAEGIIILIASFVITYLVMGPAYCKCEYCGYKIRPYEIHKCKVSGLRRTCK